MELALKWRLRGSPILQEYLIKEGFAKTRVVLHDLANWNSPHELILTQDSQEGRAPFPFEATEDGFLRFKDRYRDLPSEIPRIRHSILEFLYNESVYSSATRLAVEDIAETVWDSLDVIAACILELRESQQIEEIPSVKNGHAIEYYKITQSGKREYEASQTRQLTIRDHTETSPGITASGRPSLIEWAGAPRTTLAIAFTDVVDSTRLTGELGEERMAELRRAHFASVRRLIHEHRGREIKTIGDAFMVAFRTAVDGLDFSLALQHATCDDLLRVRIGIHVGPVSIEEEDAFGPMVNYASRVQAQAEGSDVWVSDRAREDIEAERASRHDSLTWTEHPDRKLKGINGRHRLWSVAITIEPSGATKGENPKILADKSLTQKTPVDSHEFEIRENLWSRWGLPYVEDSGFPSISGPRALAFAGAHPDRVEVLYEHEITKIHLDRWYDATRMGNKDVFVLTPASAPAGEADESIQVKRRDGVDLHVRLAPQESGLKGPRYPLLLENGGDRTAYDVEVELKLPPAMALNKGTDGGWHQAPSLDKPKLPRIDLINPGGSFQLGVVEVRPGADPSVVEGSHRIEWKITRRDSPPCQDHMDVQLAKRA